MFLPGDHVLDMNITVVIVARLTMCGESSSGNIATIVCSGSVGLSFTSMVELKIDSLAFTSHKRKRTITLLSTSQAVVHVTLFLQYTHAEIGNCTFHDNLGTALVVNNTNTTLAGRNEFKHNYILCGNILTPGGGAIAAVDSNITFIGNTTFLDNKVSFLAFHMVLGGGAIFISGHTVLSFNGISNFINNSADYGGAISTSCHTVLSFNGISNFINTSVDGSGGDGGGAISTSGYTILSFNETRNFINNSAGLFGFNSADGGNGGAIYTYQPHNTVLSFNGISNFINNSADRGGAISTISNTVLSFNGINNFINNSAEWGGAIHTLFMNTLTFNGTIYFANNGHHGGRVNTNTQYTYGGGMYLGVKCTFSTLPNTSVYWENNHASLGGAIYVQDASPISHCWTLAMFVPKAECFFQLQLPGHNLSNGINVQLVFKNNFADVAGSVLYGGAIDHCKLTHGLDSHSSGEVFDMIAHNNDTDYDTTSNISSDPLQVCSCENNLPECRWPFYHFPCTVYPGEMFKVSVVAVGQRNGTVPSTVRSAIDNIQYPGAELLDSGYLQKTDNTYTKLNYTVFTWWCNFNIRPYYT